MPSTPDQLREEMGMSFWPDKQLVSILAKRFTEQSVMMQLMEVTAEDGTAFGIELLLLGDVQEGRPEDRPRDVLLDAMIMETRRRIATRFEHGAYTVYG